MNGEFIFGLTRGDMWVILVLVSVVCSGIFIFLNSGYEQGKVANPPKVKPLLMVVGFTFLAVMLAPQGNVQIVHAIKAKQILAESKELKVEIEELMEEISFREANDPSYDTFEAMYDLEKMQRLYARADELSDSR